MEICSDYYLDEVRARIEYFKAVRGAIWHDENLCRWVYFRTLGNGAQRAFKAENREHFEHNHRITPELQRLKQDLQDLADSIEQRFKDEELNAVEIMQKYPLQRGLAGVFYEWMRLIEDFYPEPQQEQATEPQQILPEGLNIRGAETYFSKAITRGWIERETKGLTWKGFGRKPSVAQFAYLCGRVYGYVHSNDRNEGERVPYKALEGLFSVKRLDRSLKQVYEAKKPQCWRKDIDNLFD